MRWIISNRWRNRAVRREPHALSPPPAPPAPRARAGFGLTEVLVAQTVILLGILSICAVFVSVSRHREQTALRVSVLERAQSVLDAVRGAAPEVIVATFDGQSFAMPGVEGAHGDGSVIAVSVDDSDPTLLIVTAVASWIAGGATQTFTLRTDVFNEDG